MKSKHRTNVKRSLGTIVSFSSASMSAALLNQFFQSKAQFFYVVEMKMSPIYYGLALAIWAIWNSVNDPLAGWYMDQHPTRWGRRLPWMIAFWLPLVISFALIWNPPVGWLGNNILLFAWLLIVLIAFDTSYTIVILAWAALFPEIFIDKADRNLVAVIRQIFSLFALVLALVIPPYFVSDGNIPSYGVFGWILAAVSFINLGFAFYGSKEPKYQENVFGEEYSLRDGIALLRENKTYMAFLIGNLITYFAYGQVLAMLPFYRKFILGETEQFEIFAYGAAIGMTLLSLFFWLYLTYKKEPWVTYLLSSLIFGLTLIPVWFIKQPIYAIMTLALVGFGLAGLLMVVDLLLADIVDQDFLDRGVRREGIFFGFNGFFIRIAILLQAISLAVVSRLTGFNEKSDVQTELAKTGIKIQFIILPIIGFGIGFYTVFKYYDLHGDKLIKQKELLEQAIEKNRQEPQ